MPTDVRQALKHAADLPSSPVDRAAVRRRADALRSRRRAGRLIAISTLVLTVGGAAVFVVRDGEGSAGVEAAGRPGWKTISDARVGASIQVPTSWQRVPPIALNARSGELIVLASRAETGPRSPINPDCGFISAGGRTPAAIIQIGEQRGVGSFRPRPTAFDAGAFHALQGGPTDPLECPGSQQTFLTTFTDQGRHIQVMLSYVPTLPGEQVQEAYAILDTLRLRLGRDANKRLDATPPAEQEVRVLVLNGSDDPTAASTTANTIRSHGYGIAGTGDTAPQSGTTVACRDGDAAARRIATDLDTAADIAAFPGSSIPGLEAADCVVIVGVATQPATQIVASVNSADGLTSGVAVLSPDGQPVRQLYTFGQTHTYGAFSVTAAGDVFYAAADPETPSGLCPPGSATAGVPDVVRVSTSDGRVERLTQGERPVVTPNGKRLAYNPGSCDEGGLAQVTIMKTQTGATSGVPRVAARSLGKMRPLAWSPGGSRLLVAISTEGNPQTDRQGGVRLMIVKPDDWSAAPARIHVPGVIRNATYLHDGRVLVQYLDAKGVHQFVAIDPESGVKERLFQSSVPDSGLGPFVSSLSADASGRVLVTYDQGTLQAWAPGDAEPTTLAASNTPTAAWLPVVDQ